MNDISLTAVCMHLVIQPLFVQGFVSLCHACIYSGPCLGYMLSFA